jgi:hypothetical protein
MKGGGRYAPGTEGGFAVPEQTGAARPAANGPSSYVCPYFDRTTGRHALPPSIYCPSVPSLRCTSQPKSTTG